MSQAVLDRLRSTQTMLQNTQLSFGIYRIGELRDLIISSQELFPGNKALQSSRIKCLRALYKLEGSKTTDPKYEDIRKTAAKKVEEYVNIFEGEVVIK